jgi:LacI family transcriptional regulator
VGGTAGVIEERSGWFAWFHTMGNRFPGNRLPTLGNRGNHVKGGCYDHTAVEKGERLPDVDGRPSRVTLKDVAAATNLSVATVSRALSGRRAVTPEVADAVLSASERLGYRPNVLARSLRERATHAVGMLVPRIADPFFPLVVEAAERQLHEEGYELFLCDSQEDPALEAVRARALVDRLVDGFIVIPCDSASAETVRLSQQTVPLVQVDRRIEPLTTDFVGTDHAAGIRLALEHVRELNCDTLAYVAPTSTASSYRERLLAYKTGAQVGFSPSSLDAIFLGSSSIEWGREAASQLLASSVPSAVICADDLIAIGVLQQFRARGVSVPAEVAVLGFDDSLAELGNPPLTTIRQPAEALGAEAAKLLLDRLRDNAGQPPRNVQLLPSLVVRESTVQR